MHFAERFKRCAGDRVKQPVDIAGRHIVSIKHARLPGWAVVTAGHPKLRDTKRRARVGVCRAGGIWRRGPNHLCTDGRIRRIHPGAFRAAWSYAIARSKLTYGRWRAGHLCAVSGGLLGAAAVAVWWRTARLRRVIRLRVKPEQACATFVSVQRAAVGRDRSAAGMAVQASTHCRSWAGALAV